MSKEIIHPFKKQKRIMKPVLFAHPFNAGSIIQDYVRDNIRVNGEKKKFPEEKQG